MVILKEQDAVNAVTKNLDEIAPGTSQMFDTSDFENRSLEETVKETIHQAINIVNMNVPAHMLEGVDVTLKGPGEATAPTKEDNVCSFSIDESDFEILRLVSVRAVDSQDKSYGRVLTESVAEHSPEGRMQLNRYVRGTWDNPVLVKMQGARQEYTYYSLRDNADSVAVTAMPVCQKGKGALWQTKDESKGQEEGYKISVALRDSIVNQLTGMVLVIYGQTDKAKYYFELAKNI